MGGPADLLGGIWPFWGPETGPFGLCLGGTFLDGSLPDTHPEVCRGTEANQSPHGCNPVHPPARWQVHPFSTLPLAHERMEAAQSNNNKM